MSYQYVAVGEMQTLTGVAWSAKILDNHNNLICEVVNHGDGRCNVYRWHDNEGMESMVRNATEDNPDSFEPLDDFVQSLWLTEYNGWGSIEEVA